MEYILEIYRPGSSDPAACIKTFNSAVPFLPIGIGDLLSTAEWGLEPNALQPLLRAINVEHVISEKSVGIDPAGTTVHRMLVYTESVADTVQTRCTRSKP